MELAGVVGIIMGFVMVVWGILGFCIPFMVYGIWQSNKRQEEILKCLKQSK